MSVIERSLAGLTFLKEPADKQPSGHLSSGPLETLTIRKSQITTASPILSGENTRSYVEQDTKANSQSVDVEKKHSRLRKSDIVYLIKRKQPFPFPAPKPRTQNILRKQPDGSLYLAWPGEGAYWLRPRQNKIEYQLPEKVSKDFLWANVEGPLASYYLGLQKEPLFHGSAVDINGKAVCFLAPSGSGKSTLAAGLALRGFPLVTDDLLRFENKDGPLTLWPGARHIRIWPKSAKALMQNSGSLPSIVPTAQKKKIAEDLLPGGAARMPLPVSCIFTFERSKSVRKPRAAELSGREKWEALGEHLLLIFPKDREFASAVFKKLNTLSKNVPVKHLIIPDRLSALDQTLDFILASV